MEIIRRWLCQPGHGARSSQKTQRPRIGRTALVTFGLSFTALSPSLASAQPQPSARVIGGTTATAGDVSAAGRWSAVVAVFATDEQGTRLCTGTVIAPNWVATAAHCLAKTGDATQAIAPTQVYVASGVTSVSNAGDSLIAAQSTHVHPGFAWVNASWDAALIELETTVPTTPFALPDPLRASTYVAGSTDNVAGFGRSQAANTNSSGTLRTGRLEQVNTAACANYNPGSTDYADCYLPGTARQATCFGDSGGPLVRFDSTQGGTPVLWGITSTGPDPCDAATGGAFAPAFETRVTAVVDWLKATMSGTTYVPGVAPGARSGATPNAAPSGSSGQSKTVKAPAGGTGIGIFQAKINRAPSRTRGGKLTLASSFVGATGSGLLEIQRCKGRKCQTVASSKVSFAKIGVTVRASIGIPRCLKGTTVSVRLSVRDTDGTLRDIATERIARCR